jgi:hypothetical protein
MTENRIPLFREALQVDKSRSTAAAPPLITRTAERSRMREVLQAAAGAPMQSGLPHVMA